MQSLLLGIEDAPNDLALHKHGEALIHPKVLPGLRCDEVTHPAVGDFVCDNSGKRTIASEQSWGDER